MQKKILIIAGVVILIAGMVGAWFYFKSGDSSEQSNPTADLFDTSAPANPAPAQNTTQDLPDVVARVNGQEITKAELENSQAQILASQGVDPTTLTDDMRKQLITQALDGLVSNSLIKQATASSGVTADDSEVDAQIEVVKGQFDAIEKYQEALTAQGMTEADFRKIVASDLTIQKYLESTLNLKAVDVTEEELAALYEKESAAALAVSSTQALPPLAEIHDQFKAFYVQQKQQEMVVNHVKELSSKANIEILI